MISAVRIVVVSAAIYLPFKNSPRVSPWLATHCKRASALHTLLDAAAVS